jgi:hypothetical protein
VEAANRARRLSAEEPEWARAAGELVSAGVERVAGRRSAALARLTECSVRAERCGFQLVAQAAAHCRRELDTDERSDRASRDNEDGVSREGGVKRRDLWARAMAPGLSGPLR